ncbi:flagellar biosynthesis protein FlgN [Bradyrhizobium sp. CCGUVB1N3]|uniref:flagellar biosynthesis protein FlgN n=1 Tax=Bradyrhizobium sp. CCGUVB1N3 TaxID=2949629 RepID=UPI0020B3E892|nr:flagellar biosynthesis protein FlgN [Bradyrhizobium sp. CCGUVB1N3]MCP3472664.1 flagellar biosynthesis protein FlgN [Bradyrhizobium sp. CCGUVB1N3]
MQAEERATSMVEQRDTETVGLGGAALPVHLPDVRAEPSPAPVDPSKSDEVRGLLAAIRRLESVIEEETLALQTGKKIDFDDFSTRKSRSMLEFVRLIRAQLHLGVEAEVTDEIQNLRRKLEKNRAVLEMHYDAVREVAEIIVRAIREAESDGTYSGRTSQEGK